MLYRIRFAILGLILAASVDGLTGFASAEVIVLASTTDYKDPKGMPVSATTSFYEPAFTGPDTNQNLTAQHELLHAIGFTKEYQNFLDHIQPSPQGASQPFTQNPDGSGTLLALLKPPGDHVDPLGGVRNGFDQKLSLMRPDGAPFSGSMGRFEQEILDAAFDWSHKNLAITPVYDGAFTAVEKDAVVQAVAEAENLFRSDRSGSKFTWTVKIVNSPEPSSLIVFAASLGVLFVVKRRRSVGIRGVLPSPPVGPGCDEKSPLASKSVLLLITATLLTLTPGVRADPDSAPAAGLAQWETSRLIESLESSSQAARRAASVELFRRGRAVLPDFEMLNPRRIDIRTKTRTSIVYHLIKGLEPDQYKDDEIYLWLTNETDRQEIIRMGRRRGFILKDDDRFGSDGSVSCYVKLLPGKKLATVMKEILIGS